ncbi:hypothetical protein MmiHf6_14860 [Methanimicrococcus hongohii]|uniref:Transmembrane protein n=1 Tax=Methanimicrococcus hongohii TaxID=3028295 RepID=A0AA96ZUV2_9EURY|nr:hypothetical protein [Methanimicrococcus sp. Hf6]WNY24157.1 hypothetical protein MmiHf6_14860 [Methanimicrococcus sp. Hf6]
MNIFKVLTALTFLVTCFFIWLGLSDESAFYYLPQLGLWSFVFAAMLFLSFIYDKKGQLPMSDKSMALAALAGIVILLIWVIILVYIKRLDLLAENEIYSIGRFVYVFGTAILSCLIVSVLVIFSLKPQNFKKVILNK